MTGGRRRLFAWIALVALASLIVTIVGMAWFVFATRAGAQFALNQLLQRFPEMIVVEELEGRLRGPLELRGVTVTTETARIGINRLHIEWSPWRLVRREVYLSAVRATEVDVTLAEVADSIPREPTTLTDVTMPVRLTLVDGVAETIAIHRSGTETPFALDSVSASGLSFTDRLQVQRLALAAPGLGAEINGELLPKALYPLEFDLEWTYVANNAVRFAGEGSIRGNVEQIELRHEVTAPFQATLAAAVRDPLDSVRFDATITALALESGYFDSTLTPVRADARFEARGSVDAFSGTGSAQATTDPLGPLDMSIEFERQEANWLIRRLRIASPSRPAEVMTSGTVTVEPDGPRFDLTTDWRRLTWPLQGESVAQSRRGSIAVTGSLDDYRASLSGDFFGPNLPPGTLRLTVRGGRDRLDLSSTARTLGGELRGRGEVSWRQDVQWRLAVEADHLDPGPLTPDSARWSGDVSFAAQTSGRMAETGPLGVVTVQSVEGTLGGYPVDGSAMVQLDRQRAHIDSATIRALGGEVRGWGDVVWNPRVSWQLALEAADLQPSRLVPDSSEWPGELSVRLTTEGALEQEGPAGTVRVEQLAGTLRGNPVQGTTSVAFAPDGYEVPELELDWGSMRLRASGTITDTLSFEFDLDAPEVGVAVPDASGAVRVTGTLGGSRDVPTVNASLMGTALTWNDYSIGRITGNTDLDLQPAGRFDLHLESENVTVGAQTIDRAAIDSRGTSSDHTATGSLTSTVGRLSLSANGGLVDDRWQGTVDQFDVQHETAGMWNLEDAVGVDAGRDHASIDRWCWISEDARLCNEGSWYREGSSELRSSVENLALTRLRDLVPKGWTMTGSVNGSAMVSVQADSTLTGDLNLAVGPGEFSYTLVEGPQVMSYDQGIITGTAGAEGVSTTLDLSVESEDGSAFATVAGRLDLPGYTAVGLPLDSQQIGGELRAQFTDLSVVEAVYPELARTEGTLDLNVRAVGTVGQPALIGEAKLAGGQADLPEFGLELRDAELTATGTEAGEVLVSGRAQSGGGTVNLEGTSPIAPTEQSPLRLTIRGDRLQVMNTPEIQAFVSPELEITAVDRRIDATGEIRIDRANVQLREVPASAVQLSPDVVIIGDSSVTAPPTWEVHSRIRLVLGDSVSYQGLGFSARPEGSLLAIDEPGQPTLGTGQVLIREGRYRAYGQDLTIDSGRVLFGGGPVDNPGLDLRAYRRAQDGTVAGLQINGTLQSPVTTMYSEPPMTQSEALAYLVLGRPLGEASTTEGGQLARAATSLGIRGGDLLAKRLAGQFGLDEARIESEGELREAAFVAGKYLSPKLYVSYGIGLFDRVSTWRARYLLSSKWTLQAETGETTGADLFFRIERGR